MSDPPGITVAMTSDQWRITERDPDRVEALARALGVSPVTAHLLVLRGFDDVEAAQGFLRPSLSALLDPGGLPEVDLGAARLARAVEAREPVLLFGDYDVDGTTGAAVLKEVLEALGGDVAVHIPDRAEGYGVNTARLERAAAEGVRVVVTIDNGIAALEEAACARRLGLDLIVADHHTMGDELPEAVARVHPRLPGSTYANPDLCGAGVAFKLAWATAKALAPQGRVSKRLQDVLLRALGLVALGTVADVVALTGENRVIVRYGLRALGRTALPGVRALLESARVEEPTGHDVAFRLAPRLNAAGRMGSARRAFDLLTTRDEAEARALAAELERENKRRREVQARVHREACAQVEEAYGPRAATAGVVVWGEGWPHGVVGIVAAKLTEAYQRPALVVSVEGDRAKGSGRTAGDVDLLQALEEAREHLTRGGGHAAAVGFSLDAAALPALRAAFPRGVKRALGLDRETPDAEVAARLEGYEVAADVEVRLDEVSRQLVDELEQLSPFGQGNPDPLFAAREVQLAGEPRLLGRSGQHVELHVRQGEQVLRAVAFRQPELWDLLRDRAGPRPGGPRTFEVAFRPRLNRWNGQARLELQLEALRFPGEPRA